MKCRARCTAALLWYLLPCAVAASGAVAADQAAERAAIAGVIDDSIGWFADKDFDRLYGALADDADFFIYHPDSQSTIHGIEAFRKFSEFFRNPDLVYAGHEIGELRIGLSGAGDAAWFSAMLHDCSEYRGETSCWDGCRWTGVLEKRDGRWVIVQMHFSFAEDKVAAETRRSEREQAGRVFGSYEEMRGVVVELSDRKRYAEAAAILAGAVARYPDHVLANTGNLALLYARLDNREEAVRALEEGHRRGIFYGKYSFRNAAWDSLASLPAFQRVLARNDELIAEAQKSAVMKLEVSTPEGYDPGRAYPLFIALHGGGENIAQFRPHWTSPRLREEFIVAYVQSSQVATMDGYHWQDAAVTARELGEAYRTVAGKYAVDTRRVLVGGFSSGGYGALVTALAGALPAAGFVVLCPEVPVGPDRDSLAAAVRRGLRGTVLTTGRDQRLEQQKSYVSRLSQAGLDIHLVVTPDIGHWYPDDFESMLDEAMAHIDATP